MVQTRPLNPKTIALRERRALQAVEGAQAMRDYVHTREAARNRLAELRAEREAREAQAREKG